MYGYELQKLIRDFEEYCETVVKNETPEESRAALIRTGVMDEGGNLIFCRKNELDFTHGPQWGLWLSQLYE